MLSVAVRHVAFEDLGLWEPEIRAHGYDVTYLDAGVDDLVPAARADLVVVLGGPIGVGQADTYPFLTDEIALVRQRLAEGRATIGVCLGAQVMAAALGVRVFPGTWEVGWQPVTVTDAGRAGVLRHLEGAPVLHWHGDTFDLPEGAELLASTAATPHQAFSHGAGLALQFHPEVDGQEIERWLIGHTADLHAHGTDIEALRERSRRAADHAAMAGVAMMREYLRGLARAGI